MLGVGTQTHTHTRQRCTCDRCILFSIVRMWVVFGSTLAYSHKAMCSTIFYVKLPTATLFVFVFTLVSSKWKLG